jgi:ethanolamine utilization protein EutN
MILARVVGHVVATQKNPSHEGQKILRVQPIDLQGKDSGDSLLALDGVDAGLGDRVVVTQEGWSACWTVQRPGSPIDAAVIGVVDTIELSEPGKV